MEKRPAESLVYGHRKLESIGCAAIGDTCRLVYNSLVIALAQHAMTVVTWFFIVGVIGSLIVVLISFFEDLTELFGKE